MHLALIKIHQRRTRLSLVQQDVSSCLGVSLALSDSFIELFLKEVDIYTSCMTGSGGSHSRPATWWKLKHPFSTPKPVFTCLGLHHVLLQLLDEFWCMDTIRMSVFSYKTQPHSFCSNSPFDVLLFSWCSESIEQLS